MIRDPGQRGLTLVELVVATGLFALLLVALVELVDTSLGLWSATEARRDRSEQASALTGLLAEDLGTLEPGPRGDLVVDWAAHDLDGDGIAGLLLQRVRLVRRVSAAQLSRRSGRGVERSEQGPPSDGVESARLGALVETVWVLLPGAGAGAPGRLLRGERLFGSNERDSFLAADFFDARGTPPADALSVLSEEVLWIELLCASQATSLADGWRRGPGAFDASAAWDAWTSGRLDVDLSPWNELSAGIPRAGDLPVLPRRIGLVLELERAADRDRRTTLAEPVGPGANALVLRDPRFAPPAGAFARLGEEWVHVRAAAGTRLSVERGARGSRPAEHSAGTLVHFGTPSVCEVVVAVHREDWGL